MKKYLKKNQKKNLHVRKCQRAILFSCNLIPSCKKFFVQKYVCAILCTHAIFSPRAILYARANLTAT